MWPMGLRDLVDDLQRDIEMEKEGVYNDRHRSQSRKYRTNNRSLMKKFKQSTKRSLMQSPHKNITKADNYVNIITK